MEQLIFVIQLTLSVFLGGLLGWQREKIGRAAGPRTYALIAMGATLFTKMSLNGFGNSNPSHIAAQIVVGIGFLGAGAILHKDGGVIVGLTTAAGMWAVSAIGMMIGLEWWWQAVFTTLLMFLILSLNDHDLVKRTEEKKKK